MKGQLSRLWRDLQTAELRPNLRTPGISRFNVWFRLVGYGIAAVGCPVVVDGTLRQAVTLGLVGVPIMYAVFDLRSSEPRPAPPAFLDLLVSPAIVSVGLGAPALGLAVAAVVATFLHASVTLPLRTLAVGGFAAAVITAVSGVLFAGSTPSHPVAGWLFVVAMIGSGGTLLVFQWRQVASALRASEAELNTVLAHTPIVLMRVRPDWTLASVSRPVAPECEVGMNGREAIPEPLQKMVEQGLQGEPAVGDFTIAGRTFEVTCQPIEGDVLITGFDITERQQARAELEALIRTKDQFVASISHELRTPLTAVLGFASELQLMGTLDGEAHLFVDTIVEQASDMAAIIDDLLVAVRAELDIFTVRERPVDLSVEVERVVKSVTPRMHKPIVTSPGDGTVIADGERVRQVIRNLVVNADRYGGQHVEVTVRRRGGVGTVYVRDDGSPIPAEYREKMFAPFESSGMAAGRTAALGLGLSVSRRLAELMGGTLAYEHVDGWSVFSLELPLADTAQLSA